MGKHIEIKSITDRKQWEHFVLSCPWSPFFQSWAFGEAQEKSGMEVARYAVIHNKKIIAAAQTFLVKAKRGNFVHLRHAPLFHEYSKPAFQKIIEHVSAYAKKKGAWSLRVSPLVSSDSPLVKDLIALGGLSAPVHNQDAENCMIVQLKGRSVTDVFNGFRKTTRNLIRRAEKDGVTIRSSHQESDINIFFKLYNETARRDHFIPHKGIRQELSSLQKQDAVALLTAYHQGEPLASSLIVFYGKQAIYHHSGSVLSKVPANYLLQWHAIQEAHKRGMHYYNLWGVAPEDKPRHPWNGLTTFKKGFGGNALNFIHAYDIPLSTMYYLSYAYQTLWSRMRGY